MREIIREETNKCVFYQNIRLAKKCHVNLKCLINMYFINSSEDINIFHCHIPPNNKSVGI